MKIIISLYMILYEKCRQRFNRCPFPVGRSLIICASNKFHNHNFHSHLHIVYLNSSNKLMFKLISREFTSDLKHIKMFH